MSAAAERLRTPPLVVAVVLAVLVVLVELGAPLLVRAQPVSRQAAEVQVARDTDCEEDRDPACDELADQMVAVGALGGEPPGLGIPYLALVDVLLLATAGLLGLGLVVAPGVQARLQGVGVLVLTVLVAIAAVVLAVLAVAQLLLRLALLLAPPWGTLTYLAIWGSFPRAAAGGLLALLLAMKLAFAACLVAAQQRFLRTRSLVLLTLTSLGLGLLVAFLHALVPGSLVSITDALAAAVVAVVALVWALVLAVFSIVSVVKAVKVRREQPA